jgi:caa(3)-type oxidase subunit IV
MSEHEHEIHEPSHYIKIWALLLVLLVVSILGPMLEIQVLTLITAFGIAIVKAYIVASYFMHLNIEKKYVVYMLSTMLAFMFLFFAGVSPDVLNHRGQNWENKASQEWVKKKMKEIEAKGGVGAPDHGHSHGGGASHSHGEGSDHSH